MARDLQNVDPLLGALRDNGGPTFTSAPAIGSPAIDAGNPATCTPVDQRSIMRPQGASCDIGAFETARVTSATAIASEVEPNNVIDQANLLVFNAASQAARTGTISATTDLDIYTFSAQPGATVAISLTNLPADYDLALLSDPRVTIPVSDSLDLSSIADNSRSDAPGPARGTQPDQRCRSYQCDRAARRSRSGRLRSATIAQLASRSWRSAR